MTKRAYRDAKRDYVYEEAAARMILFRLFWAAVLLGMGYKFFGVEVYDDP